MEGVWKLNPFYWVALRRLSRTSSYGMAAKQDNFELTAHNSFKNHAVRVSKRAIHVFVISFFMIGAPIYAYFGMQPVSSIEAASYPMLSIPEIGLDTAVAPVELVDQQLIAPATIAGVYQRGEKSFIIGHSSTVFKDLDNVSVNSRFTYNEKEYIINDISTVEKNSIDMNEILSATEEPTIVIMTCAGEALPNQDATHRLIINATQLNN